MKLTLDYIESQIAATRYISRDTYERMGTLTICVLEMKNGLQLVGQSACLDEATFDANTGRELARRDAVSKIWQLEGYLAASLTRKARASLEHPGQLGFVHRQQLIKDDVTSLLEHGYITAAQAVQSAVTQAFAAGYAAAKREGQS